MDIFKVVAFAIVATILIVILKEQRKEIALMLAIISCLGIIVFAIDELAKIIDLLNSLADKSGINKEFLIIIIKITGIAYIVEFGKNICVDAGQSAIGTKLEMAGKVIIVSLSIPIISSLLTILSGLV